MNISSIPPCAPTADAAFGPVVDAACRDGFDFTLVFEQSIFVLLPAAMLVLMAPLRLLQLRKSPIKVVDQASRVIKLVSRLTARYAPTKASKQKLIASLPSSVFYSPSQAASLLSSWSSSRSGQLTMDRRDSTACPLPRQVSPSSLASWPAPSRIMNMPDPSTPPHS